MFPAFNSRGLLPEGNYPMTLAKLRDSFLVRGRGATNGAGCAENWDESWRATLVDNLGSLAQPLWEIGIEFIWLDGSFPVKSSGKSGRTLTANSDLVTPNYGKLEAKIMSSPTHKHLIRPTKSNLTLPEVLEQLEDAHTFLVKRCSASLADLSAEFSSLHRWNWGIEIKRKKIEWDEGDAPVLIGKSSESFSEVVNMLATLERLIDGVRWFIEQPEYRDLKVSACNPSTSSDKKGDIKDNDLVLNDAEDSTQVRVLCEVCDIAGDSGGGGKEVKELESLECDKKTGFPDDGKHRFICTSPEFAKTLQKPTRLWKKKSYYYKEPEIVDGSNGTVMLRVVNSSNVL